MNEPSVTSMIENFSKGGMAGGGYRCPVCGEVVLCVTYGHAERHGMTREELKSRCKPVGGMQGIESACQKRKAAKHE